ncbi:MAG TPA: DUF1641 domain-containing protein [Terracidiphilus sp.]|nr:DUF1641 domain-containing protein [Terracidiphilus sp.]
MAQPIEFAVRPPAEPYQKHPAAKPTQESYAETRAVVYSVLDQARQQGLFDLLRGLMGAKGTIFTEAANFIDKPESTAAMRNTMALGKVLGAIDPEVVSRATKDFEADSKRLQASPPPSLWELFKLIRRPESRRGLALALTALSAIGRAETKL